MFGKRFSRALVLATTASLTMAAVALADDATVDSDIATPGNQNTVNLAAAPGGTVNTSAGIKVEWSGSKHLAPGSAISFVDAGSPQTTLPSGYTVGAASGTVPTGADWADNLDSFGVTSAISFTAPATPGEYSYTVKFDLSSYTCAAGTNPAGGCLANVGGAFTINLTVSAPSCSYRLDFLSPLDDSSTVGGTVINTGKNGRTIPVKVEAFRTCGSSAEVELTGELLTAETKSLRIGVNALASCPAGTSDGVESFADAGGSNDNGNRFRWTEDAPGFWIYNLDTKGLSLVTNSCYRLDVFLMDDSASPATSTKISTAQWAVFKPTK